MSILGTSANKKSHSVSQAFSTRSVFWDTEVGRPCKHSDPISSLPDICSLRKSQGAPEEPRTRACGRDSWSPLHSRDVSSQAALKPEQTSAATSVVPEKSRRIRIVSAVRTAAFSPAQGLDWGTQLPGPPVRPPAPPQSSEAPGVDSEAPAGTIPQKVGAAGASAHGRGHTVPPENGLPRPWLSRLRSWPPAAPQIALLSLFTGNMGTAWGEGVAFPYKVHNMERSLTGCLRACVSCVVIS